MSRATVTESDRKTGFAQGLAKGVAFNRPENGTSHFFSVDGISDWKTKRFAP
jgi:hypothetical protein